MAAELMGATSVRLFHEHVLVKEANADVTTPWHHDMPYYCVDALKTVSFWIPGDAVAFDFRTVHGAPANHSTHQQRHAFSLRLVGDDAHFWRPEGVSSPPFRDVKLAQGELLVGPEFPLIPVGSECGV